jgi:hypothetical protein
VAPAFPRPLIFDETLKTGLLLVTLWRIRRGIFVMMTVATATAWSRVDESAHSEGTSSRADFVFDRLRNVYICPGGELRLEAEMYDGRDAVLSVAAFFCLPRKSS